MLDSRSWSFPEPLSFQPLNGAERGHPPPLFHRRRRRVSTEEPLLFLLLADADLASASPRDVLGVTPAEDAVLLQRVSPRR